MAVVTIDPKDFVRWIFSLPILKRIKPLQVGSTAAVARRLVQLSRMQPELDLRRLAIDVLFVPGAGDVASNADCDAFLDNMASCLPGHDIDATLRLLRETSDPGRTSIASGCGIEYRALSAMPGAPMYMSMHKFKKRMPSDDVTWRICEALDVMTAAQCTRPATVVANVLKEHYSKKGGILQEAYCTVQHVRSRYKSFPERVPTLQQELPPWLYHYWCSLVPENAGKSVADREWPERFVISKCDC
jgi:hypothetical protein